MCCTLLMAAPMVHVGLFVLRALLRAASGSCGAVGRDGASRAGFAAPKTELEKLSR
jgi:hypothetical protein